MRRLQSDEIKQVELNILLKFDEFCKQHKLRYYLAGGTLLGAIRHKGFIPWDDDIDVCMPRVDYEKVIKTFKLQDGRYKLYSSRTDDFSAPFIKIVDIKTKVVSQYEESNINKKIWIDIFPVDGLPGDIKKVKYIYNVCGFYRTILSLCNVRLGEGRTIFRKYGKYIAKPLANIYGKQRCVVKIEQIAAKYPYEKSEYVGVITWGLYGIGERMLKSEFEKLVEVDFEGHKFPAFSCWDSYLRGLYHDYMQLPPIEKRQTHNIEVYLIEEEDK